MIFIFSDNSCIWRFLSLNIYGALFPYVFTDIFSFYLRLSFLFELDLWKFFEAWDAGGFLHGRISVCFHETSVGITVLYQFKLNYLLTGGVLCVCVCVCVCVYFITPCDLCSEYNIKWKSDCDYEFSEVLFSPPVRIKMFMFQDGQFSFFLPQVPDWYQCIVLVHF